MLQTNNELSDFTAQKSEVSQLKYISLEELTAACDNRVNWLVPHWKEYEIVIRECNSLFE